VFFASEIVTVPDAIPEDTLKVNGGPGQIRAAMNLVNGWKCTRPDPRSLSGDGITRLVHAAWRPNWDGPMSRIRSIAS
jgi:hypothetical protein